MRSMLRLAACASGSMTQVAREALIGSRILLFSHLSEEQTESMGSVKPNYHLLNHPTQHQLASDGSLDAGCTLRMIRLHQFVMDSDGIADAPADALSSDVSTWFTPPWTKPNQSAQHGR